MTPKEKAEELVKIYLLLHRGEYDNDLINKKIVFNYIDKEAAIILVNELIKETGSKYWYDVKQEIKKL